MEADFPAAAAPIFLIAAVGPLLSESVDWLLGLCGQKKVITAAKNNAKHMSKPPVRLKLPKQS
jgi:hypothetical protein